MTCSSHTEGPTAVVKPLVLGVARTVLEVVLEVVLEIVLVLLVVPLLEVVLSLLVVGAERMFVANFKSNTSASSQPPLVLFIRPDTETMRSTELALR